MAVSLTIENINSVAKKLEAANRLALAALNAADGGVEPFVASSVADVRTAISGASDVTAAAKALIDLVA